MCRSEQFLQNKLCVSSSAPSLLELVLKVQNVTYNSNRTDDWQYKHHSHPRTAVLTLILAYCTEDWNELQPLVLFPRVICGSVHLSPWYVAKLDLESSNWGD